MTLQRLEEARRRIRAWEKRAKWARSKATRESALGNFNYARELATRAILFDCEAAKIELNLENERATGFDVNREKAEIAVGEDL